MKKNLYPDCKKCIVTCACGYSFETSSTVDKLHVEICSQCHPFYTGKQKLVDTAGRVEQFIRKYEKSKKMQSDAALKKVEKEEAFATSAASSRGVKKETGAKKRSGEAS